MNANSLGDYISRRTVDHYAPDLGIEPPEWTNAAVCASVDPEVFHGEKGASLREAKAICRVCDVRAECLIFAMLAEPADYLRFGVFGGLGPVERRKLGKSGWLPGDPTPDVTDAYERTRVPCPSCGMQVRNLRGHIVVHRDRAEAVA